MTDTTPPTAPESLPTCLADGLPKQDESTLEEIQEYAQALINHREQSVDHADLSESAEPVNDSDEGTLMLEKTECGDETCHCAEDDGELQRKRGESPPPSGVWMKPTTGTQSTCTVPECYAPLRHRHDHAEAVLPPL